MNSEILLPLRQKKVFSETKTFILPYKHVYNYFRAFKDQIIVIIISI